MAKSTTVRKHYRIEIPGVNPVIIRQTTTWVHAVKHSCYAAELQITVRVVDNLTEVVVLEVPAIDKAHSIKPRCKRDKRYAKLAKKGKN